LKHERYYETSQQLAILQSKEDVANTDRFKEKLNYINNYKDSLFKSTITVYGIDSRKIIMTGSSSKTGKQL